MEGGEGEEKARDETLTGLSVKFHQNQTNPALLLPLIADSIFATLNSHLATTLV